MLCGVASPGRKLKPTLGKDLIKQEFVSFNLVDYFAEIVVVHKIIKASMEKTI